MNSKIILLFSVLIISSFNVWGQKDTSNSSRVKVFDTNDSNNRHIRKRTPITTTIMMNPYHLVAGDFPVYYEQKINDNWAVEVAPGITYHDLWFDINDISFQFKTPIPNPNNDNAKYQLGYSIKLAARYFFGKDNMFDGAYISPEIGYRHYSLSYPKYDLYGNATSISTDGHINATDFKLIFGYEAETDWIDNLYVDEFIGIGTRSYSDYEYIWSSGSGATYTTTNTWVLAVYGGFKMGIAF